MKKQKNKKKKFEKYLEKTIKRKDYIKIYRSGTDGEANVYGFILQMSKDYLLLQVEDEFNLNGYAIIRKDGFDSIRLNENEVFRRSVMEKEGILKSNLGLKGIVCLDSWATIFSSIVESGHYAIVECEDLKEPSLRLVK